MKPEDLLGLIARRNTIHQERQVLLNKAKELELETARALNEERNLAAEQNKLNDTIFKEGFNLEFVDEWWWQNKAGEKINVGV
jgi:hypothetical protein